MTHVITTYGGGELFFLVFNGIAALFKHDATGMVLPLMRIGLMVGLVYTLILMFLRSSLVEGLQWILWVIIATNLLFLPKTTVLIHDPLTKDKFKVDHVPLALGVFASCMSHIGKTVTEHLESVFTLPDYMPYHQMGVVFASSLMSQVGQFRIIDPRFKGNMERFINQCVVYDALIGNKYTLQDLQRSPDIWKLVSSQASPVLGFLYHEAGSQGSIVTCREGAQKLNGLWKEEIGRAITRYGTRVHAHTLTEAAFSTELLGSLKLLAGARSLAESSLDLLRQEMMIKAIEESTNNKLSELGSASHYAATKALLQQRSTYAIAGDIAARTLPLFKNVIEALSYALFIFIVVLALLPQGYRVLITYFGILLWTQLWAPLYAVLNLAITLYGRAETHQLFGSTGFTLLNSTAILNANADMVSLAAWLAVSIPFISYGILKQGAAAFVGLAHHLGSAMQAAASSTASEAVSGNISLGNISLGTQAYQNQSAFQHHTSPLYSGHHFQSLSTSGVEQSTFGDGSQALMDHSFSRLRTQIMGTENTSMTAQDSLHKATSVLQSTSVAASEAFESSLQDTVSFMKHVGQSFSQDTSTSKNITLSEARSLQEFQNYVTDIRKNSNLTESQAFEAAIGAKLGTPEIFGGFGISGSTSASSQGARQQAIDMAEGISNQTHYSENFERVLSAAQAYAQSRHDTKGLDLGNNALSSLTKAKSLREEVSAAHSQVESLTHDLSSSQSQSFVVQRDLTQDILEFISRQPLNSGPTGQWEGLIGHEGARKILEMGGEERDVYLKRFQETHPQYSLQGINPLRKNHDLAAQSTSAAQTIREGTSVKHQHHSDREMIHQKVANEGLKAQALNTVSEALPPQNLTSIFKKGETLLNHAQDELGNKHHTLASEAHASYNKNLSLEVLTKGADFLNPFSGSMSPQTQEANHKPSIPQKRDASRQDES